MKKIISALEFIILFFSLSFCVGDVTDKSGSFSAVPNSSLTWAGYRWIVNSGNFSVNGSDELVFNGTNSGQSEAIILGSGGEHDCGVFDDFEVEFEFTITNVSIVCEAGILLRSDVFTTPPIDYFWILMQTTDSYAFGKHIPAANFLRSGSNNNLNTGDPASNKVKISASGNSFTLYFNDVQISTSITDSSFTKGGIVLFIKDCGATEVLYSNFTITPL